MFTDRFGTRLTTRAETAATLFETATHRILAHRPGIDVLLQDAAAAAPDWAGAPALRGLCQVLLAREATVQEARSCLASARAALEAAAPGEDERALVAALQIAVHGGFRRAAGVLEAHVERAPRRLLFAKLAHALRFMSGDGERLTLGIETVLRHAPPGAEGMGFMLGCLAFGREEAGDFPRAEELAREALRRQPDDAWAMHALSHTHEMTGRFDLGLAVLEAHRASWIGCNNFALHMSWHAALFHLEAGRSDEALQLFDTEVWPRASEDFRDISNAVSLLWRLEARGVPVGSRWRSVAEAASRHVGDRTYAFACLHHLIALLAAGRLAEAGLLVQAMERNGAPGNDQEQVLRQVGRPLARLLVNAAQRRATPVDMRPLLPLLPSLGGSFAQRDLFLQALAGEASRAADGALFEEILSVRARLKSEDHFARTARRRFDQNLPITA